MRSLDNHGKRQLDWHLKDIGNVIQVNVIAFALMLI